MHTDQLLYFIKVAETEHLTHAAEALNISQPALSSSLSRLENELGVKLFKRMGRNIYLNQFGETFLPYAKAGIQSIQDGKKALFDYKENMNRSLKFQTSLLSLYPELLAALFKEIPELSIINALDTTEVLERNLLLGITDICLATRKIESSELNMKTISPQPVRIALQKSHRLAKKDKLHVEDIKDEKFIVSGHFSFMTTGMNIIAEHLSKEPVISSIATNASEAVEFANQKIGIVPIVEIAFNRLSEDIKKNVITRPLLDDNDDCITLPYYLYWRKKDANVKLKFARQLILDYMADLQSNE